METKKDNLKISIKNDNVKYYHKKYNLKIYNIKNYNIIENIKMKTKEITSKQ
jgi:hypothetical protein